jgi:hypothetical protein
MHASFLKLLTLHLFKSNGNKKMQEELKEGMALQKMEFTNEKNKGLVKQQIEKQINLKKISDFS